MTADRKSINDAQRARAKAAIRNVQDGAHSLLKHLKIGPDDLARVVGDMTPAPCPGCPECAARGAPGVHVPLRQIAPLQAAAALEYASQAATQSEPQDALLLAAIGQDLLLQAAFSCLGISVSDEKQRWKTLGKAGADALHAPTRDARKLVIEWWRQHGHRITKEAGADAICAARLVGESRSTVRRWLRGA